MDRELDSWEVVDLVRLELDDRVAESRETLGVPLRVIVRLRVLLGEAVRERDFSSETETDFVHIPVGVTELENAFVVVPLGVGDWVDDGVSDFVIVKLCEFVDSCVELCDRVGEYVRSFE
jgi:hypothetical protein